MNLHQLCSYRIIKHIKKAVWDHRLLWDVDIHKFDFNKGRKAVIERVVELGTFNDWYAILNMYGEECVKTEIKNLDTLLKRDINFVHKFLNIPLSGILSKSIKRK